MDSSPALLYPLTLDGERVRMEALTLAHVEALAAAAAESRDTYGLTQVPKGADAMAAYVDLVSISRFCAASSAALSSSSALDRCSFDLLILQLLGPCLELGGEPLRLLEQRVGARVRDDRVQLTPRVSVSCSRKSVCTGLNELNEASSMTPSTWSSNKIGSTARFRRGRASPSPEEIFLRSPRAGS